MLDGGPSRTSQLMNNRRAAAQPQRAPQPEPQQQPVTPQSPEPTQRPVSPPPRQSQPAKKPPIKLLVGGILSVVVLIVVGWFVWTTMFASTAAVIDSDKQQAVFFASGQVYFGKLEIVDDEFMRLTDVFYIQSNASSETVSENPEDTTAGDMQLIKLGEEVHGPEDAMVINREQVLFFEDLKPDGRVSQLIADYRSNN